MNSLHTKDFFDQLIDHIRTRLPIQNPLPTFVHNNILQMFEGKDFHDAVSEAGRLYRANPYWPLEKYTERYTEGKITEQDIFRAIEHYLGKYQSIASLEKLGLTGKDFFYCMMFSELAFNDDDVQPEMQDTHLWNLCQEKVGNETLTLKRSPIKWRAKDYWEKYHNESYALSVYPLIIRLTSSFLDQGQSFWANPFLNKGFWKFFCYDTLTVESFTSGWHKVLVSKVKKYEDFEAKDVIITELGVMGIPEKAWEEYLLDILFDLKGWSGMVNKLELEPWQATVKAPNIKLVEYIAALLLIESAMDSFHAHAQSIDLSNIYGREDKVVLKGFQLSLALYQITKNFKLDERWMQRFEAKEVVEIIDEVDEAEMVHKIRLWHEAYEHHYYRDALEALSQHSLETENIKPVIPEAQMMFCIDDREESFRRHLEEINPSIATYGVVGFFGIDMKFSSLKNQRLIAQCPPVIMPSRIIKEILQDKNGSSNFNKFNLLRGGYDLALYYHSRTLFRGIFSTLVLGMASIIPMFMQVFFPKHSKVIRKKTMKLLGMEPKTEMSIESGEEGHGYSKPEMAKIVEAIIRMCGIKPPYSRLLIACGHGSSSTNNPFKQAYGCGACGGNAGIPNSRSFAKMANDPAVREELKTLGIDLPEECYVVSAFHDTCTDTVTFFELEKLPFSHKFLLGKVRKNLKEACKRNAFERCQRFSSDLAKSSPEEALKHVSDRAEDLAQPRPEYGHCTNALSIVGRRELTKGLFMNRRSFLLSYDWATDPDGSILRQVVLGGVPVCVNINMDYYFSCVDNRNFGCGSKLPINLTSLLGVMTGSQSDLRIGLAQQMVEIHEPIRNLVMIEAPLNKVRTLFNSHPRLKNILYNHWMRMVVLDPVQKVWYLFEQNDFAPLTFENHKLKHYSNSVELLNKTSFEDDFAEIDR